MSQGLLPFCTCLILIQGCVCTTIGDLTDPGPLPEPRDPNAIRVLTWNTWLLPLGSRDRDGRCASIVSQLHSYDIIGLQEIWCDKNRRDLVSQLGDEYRIVGPETCWGHRLSGLMLLTRFDIDRCWSLRFTKESGTDALMNKGALYVRLLLDKTNLDRRLDVIVTHVQADDILSFTAPRDREAQIDELQSFIACHADAEIPRLIMGDFNIDATLTESCDQYTQLFETLGIDPEQADLVRRYAEDRSCFDDDFVTYDSRNNPLDRFWRKKRMRLDYLLNHNPGVSLEITDLRVRRFTYDTCRTCPLSDHYGLEAHLAVPEGPRSHISAARFR